MERLRPLGLCWSVALGRESRKLRELVGGLVHLGLVGLAEAIAAESVMYGSGDWFERLGPELA